MPRLLTVRRGRRDHLPLEGKTARPRASALRKYFIIRKCVIGGNAEHARMERSHGIVPVLIVLRHR